MPELNPEAACIVNHNADDTPMSRMNESVSSPLTRKRRRRAPIMAMRDCFTCQSSKKKCDRRRPYCSECLEVGRECSGYRTQLSWPIGVGSQGERGGHSPLIHRRPGLSILNPPVNTPPISSSDDDVPTSYFHGNSSEVLPTGTTWDAESSAGSIGSDASYGSMDSRGSRRGRRRWKNTNPSQTKAPENSVPQVPQVQYHCTFPGCGKDFLNRSEWDRHESSIHYPQNVWICCHNMERFPFLESSTQPNETGLGSPQGLDPQALRRMFSQCIAKEEKDRSFFRKDQFIQHLTQCHLPVSKSKACEGCQRRKLRCDGQTQCASCNRVGISCTWKPPLGIHEDKVKTLRGILTATWKRKLTYISSEAAGLHCPLCHISFSLWADRKEHFARHFEDGVFIWTDTSTAQKMGSIFSPQLLEGRSGR